MAPGKLRTMCPHSEIEHSEEIPELEKTWNGKSLHCT